LHAKEHVNHVECLGDHRVMSVGNDGFLSECFVSAGGKLVRGISIPVPGLSSASKIWTQRTEGGRPPSRLVSGYFGNTFRVVDYTHGCELFSLDTGETTTAGSYDSFDIVRSCCTKLQCCNLC
jgi:hypothetical protein